MKDVNKLKGGIYGLLVGDALGVPYEFHPAADIPPTDMIDMQPPAGFSRAHMGVPPATWSDDGAQALCLLHSLVEVGRFDLKNFSDKVLAWYDYGLWAVDNNVFDVGIQTSMALDAYRSGMAPEKCGLIRPDGKGNGALMRVLPLALWHEGTNEELVEDAHAQCPITHGNITNLVCCGLYVLIAGYLLDGLSFDDALSSAVAELRRIYSDKPDFIEEFEFRLCPDEPDIWRGNGGGYVVDSLRSAVMIMKRASSYEDAVKQAIALGDDTDTTACITGGLAGIVFGYEGIPAKWLEELRGRSQVDELLAKWIK
ncbi:ADP-ribosylglycohydrolase family protein [Ruminococcus albus]|uniref:ADP-ribosylglycohydrolase n=1 Tax=Ruminococcus albus TaxID=1264 RepID=A0A1H7L303_RUMAL|nr:ADP-ribosylglycohydrolase family protein [Ruminococcus albus]SEK93372.1 ADP-ribosylglycohydrolase [Ruminococcus albus]